MARYTLGGIYFENNQYKEAEDEFRAFLKVYPYFPNAHHLLGVVYAGQRKFSQAIAEFENELKVDRYHTLAHLNLGQLYWYEYQNREKALYHLKAALMIDPLIPERNRIRALVRMLEGRS